MVKISAAGVRAGLAGLFCAGLFARHIPVIPDYPPLAWILLSIGVFAIGWPRIVSGLRAPGVDRLLLTGILAASIHTALVHLNPWEQIGVLYTDVAALAMAFTLVGDFIYKRIGMDYTRPKEADSPRPLAGEEILVEPGDVFPAYGLVLKGESASDESGLTGAGLPVDKKPGDKIFAGCTNLTAPLLVEVLGEGQPSGSDTKKPPLPPRREDALAAKLLWIFVGLALAGGIWQLVSGGGQGVFILLFGVFAAALPAAVGVAAPIAAIAGYGKAQQDGVIFTGADAFERAAAVDTLVLDKTGTLTHGRPVVSDILPGQGWGKRDFLLLAASVSAVFGHPVFSAVAERARKDRMVPKVVERYTVYHGRGVQANIGDKIYHLGNAVMFGENSIRIKGGFTYEAYRLESEGKRVLFLAENGVVIGIIALADTVRQEAVQAVRDLIKLGTNPCIVSGDERSSVARTAAAVGITAHFACSDKPEKLAQVRRLQAGGGRVAMVGDGMSDISALAGADASIAFGDRVWADILIPGRQITLIALTLKLARAVSATTLQNRMIAALLGLVCAGAVFVDASIYWWNIPLGAVMVAGIFLSAGFVLLNSLRVLAVD